MPVRISLSAVIGAAKINPTPTFNVGLWLDKCLEAEDATSQNRAPHLAVLDKVKAPDGYGAAFERRKELLNTNPDVLIAEGKTDGRLIVGLGAKSVFEIGIALDHTWGVPLIPGSAIKGLAAATAHLLAVDAQWRKPANWPEAGSTVESDGKLNPTAYESLFGTTDQSGCVIFHDAWWIPTARMPFFPDVMTVHHKDYYEGKSVPPADWDTPTPIPFISVAGNFLFAIEGPKEWRVAAFELLSEGLKGLGIGAKTSSGYGRITLTHQKTEVEIDCENRERVRLETHAREEAARVRAVKESRENFRTFVLRCQQQQTVDFEQLKTEIAKWRETDVEFVAQTLVDNLANAQKVALANQLGEPLASMIRPKVQPAPARDTKTFDGKAWWLNQHRGQINVVIVDRPAIVFDKNISKALATKLAGKSENDPADVLVTVKGDVVTKLALKAQG